jgi:hypothetical protein
MSHEKQNWIKPPRERVLQVFAFDPSLSMDMELAVLNRLELRVPWEKLSPGPVGEYLEVVDVDPASQAAYAPVDLDLPALLAQDGLAPSEGTPQFHMQMVYAVASRTIKCFEQALGRPALWSPRVTEEKIDFIQRLRLYPHALREANAYYDPDKKAILFGYFPVSSTNVVGNLPGGMVFTCLSHDIIVHETTHALLDGLHPYFNEPSNQDVLALHEAFADIVALLQHFTYPEILRSQIARTRGDLASESLLAELAWQFGQAIGGRGALRSAIGDKTEDGGWKRTEADPTLIERTREPHQRGAVLVATLFDAFLAVYQSRTADLLRIASAGSGVLPAGSLHPDLVRRLADEAAGIATHLLGMCLRALDYCPPVDITFGEFLRAVITADYDTYPVDRDGYRIALIESFRRHGIYPSGVRSLSEENLFWQPPLDDYVRDTFFYNRLEEIRRFTGTQERFGVQRQNVFTTDTGFQQIVRDYWIPELIQEIGSSRKLKDLREQLHLYLNLSRSDHLESITRENGTPALEVSSVRPAYRVGQDGRTVADLVIEIHQKRDGYLDLGMQRRADEGKLEGAKPDFTFRGGATLLISTVTGQVRYVIGKRVGSNTRLEKQRSFLEQEAVDPSLRATYFGSPVTAYFRSAGRDCNLFALVHRSGAAQEV